MKHFKTFESFVNEKNEYLNERTKFDVQKLLSKVDDELYNIIKWKDDASCYVSAPADAADIIAAVKSKYPKSSWDPKTNLLVFESEEVEDITLTEEELNEGTAWFPGETIDDRIGDDSSEWNKFWKNAKKGDTFKSDADGVDLYTCKPGDVGKAKIKPSMMSFGHNYSRTGAEPGEDCLIIDRKPCQWIDSDYDEDDKIDTIFYTMKGENGKVFMLGEL